MDDRSKGMPAVARPQRATVIPVLVGLLTGLTVVLLGGLAGAFRPVGTTAPTPFRDIAPTPTDAPRHPLAGPWAAMSDEGRSFLVTFFEDGNAQVASPYWAAHGVWEPRGDRAARLTVVFLAVPPPVVAGPGAGLQTDRAGMGANHVTIQAEIEVDSTGDSLTATFREEETDPTGAVLTRSAGTLTGWRIMVTPEATPGF